MDGRRNSGRDIQWDQSQSEVTLAFISVLSSWKNLMKTKVYPLFNFFPAKDLFGEFCLKFGTDQGYWGNVDQRHYRPLNYRRISE